MKNKKTIFITIIAFLVLIIGYSFFIRGSKFEETISRKLFKSEKNITIKLSNTNIYTNGVNDIISDISKTVSLPKELYISGDFKILFKDDGTITSIDALLYGKNKNDFTDTFSIDYDINKSKNIKVTLNKHINIDTNYDDKYSFEPFKEYIKNIPIRYSVSSCDEKEFEIMYSGEKEWDVNTKGIIYINREGETKEPTYPLTSKTIGYMVSLFVPGKENQYTSLKYILVDNFDDIDGEVTTTIYRSDLTTLGKTVSKTLDDDTIEFQLDDNTTYKLVCTGESPHPISSLAIIKIYTLYKYNKDTSESVIVNNNVFSSNYVENIKLTFIDENLGFLSVSYKEFYRLPILYRTIDGGKTFEEISTDYQFKINGLTDRAKITSPYEIDGVLYMKFEDPVIIVKNTWYGICKSENNGETWSFYKNVVYDEAEK